MLLAASFPIEALHRLCRGWVDKVLCMLFASLHLLEGFYSRVLQIIDLRWLLVGNYLNAWTLAQEEACQDAQSVGRWAEL